MILRRKKLFLFAEYQIYKLYYIYTCYILKISLLYQPNKMNPSNSQKKNILNLILILYTNINEHQK